MTNSKITVFSAGCGLCKEAERIVRGAVADCGCSVEVKPADGYEARTLDVKAAPTIVRDGEIVCRGLPTTKDAIELLRRPS